jgi:CheY-like chemotaxis protein
MKTVLLVEDDRDTRLILEEILSGEGYEAIAVEAGDAAIQYLSTHDRPCLVLLDLRLPRMNGVSFLHWLNQQEHLRKLPVAVISALRVVDGERDHAPFRDHVVAVLRKPFTLDDVLDLIESHCGPGEEQEAA